MKRSIFVVILVAFAATASAQGPDRSKPPTLGPAPALKQPPI